MNDNAPVIELHDVTMKFGAQEVLSHLSLRIHRGETVAIIGESGCGKTVLLKLMIGLLQPSSGEVYFEGENLAKLSEKALTKVRLRFGYVFQMAALFDSLSIFDNVAFGLQERRIGSPEEIRSVVFERLQEVGLPAGIEKRKPAELSGGQRKRVGLARALALNPEVVLYDEPTTGLDPIMSDVINELIKQARERSKVTGVVVTHDMSTVRKVADRVVMLYPRNRLRAGEDQIIFNASTAELESHTDPRVSQFIRGEAGERLRELSQSREGRPTSSSRQEPR